jgi:hypothetical protein
LLFITTTNKHTDIRASLILSDTVFVKWIIFNKTCEKCDSCSMTSFGTTDLCKKYMNKNEVWQMKHASCDNTPFIPASCRTSPEVLAAATSWC